MAQRVPIEPWYRLALNLGASATVGGLCDISVETNRLPAYWRICPEELSCNLVASSPETLEGLRAMPEFQADWTMQRLVDLARSELGVPGEGRCYCLKIPAVLGGAYERSNLGTVALSELLAAAGAMARQIKDLPDGGTVELAASE